MLGIVLEISDPGNTWKIDAFHFILMMMSYSKHEDDVLFQRMSVHSTKHFPSMSKIQIKL